MFISDVHLGARGSQADRLLDFLRTHDADTICLVGDIVDGWALRSSWYWPQSHNDFVQKMLRKARKGAKVIYVPGNHDEFLRNYYGTHFPESWVWRVLRWFHRPSQAVMAATPALAAELRNRGFRDVVLWSRGVDTALFHPRSADLDLPGTKLIVGDGPARAALERKYPDAVFLGARHGEELAEIYGIRHFRVPQQDRYVRPGAAGGTRQRPTSRHYRVSRQDCVEFAAAHTWAASARVFVEHAMNVRPGPAGGRVGRISGRRCAFRGMTSR